MEGATVNIATISDALIDGLNEAAVGMIGVVADMIPVATTPIPAPVHRLLQAVYIPEIVNQLPT